MDKNLREANRIKGEKLIEKLKLRGFAADFFDSGEEMLEFFKGALEKGSSVAVGGSMTLFETGIIDYLTGNIEYDFIDRYHSDDIAETQRQALLADNFVMSSNAITMDGILYNVDGRGTRVGPLIFGPKKVYVILGMNKVVKDLDEAKKRVETIAAPANNIRLKKDNPCTAIGECVHCNKETTICNQYVITRRSDPKDRIHILLINDDFGY